MKQDILSSLVEQAVLKDKAAELGLDQLDDEARAAARRYIEDANTSSISFGNGRGVRNLFERMLVAQSNRLAESADVTTDDLMLITAADVAAARAEDTKLQEAEARAEQIAASARETVRELEALGALLKSDAEPAAAEAPAGEESAE